MERGKIGGDFKDLWRGGRTNGSGDHKDGGFGIRGRSRRVDFLKDNDFRLKGVITKVNEEGPVLGQVWEMKGIITV